MALSRTRNFISLASLLLIFFIEFWLFMHWLSLQPSCHHSPFPLQGKRRHKPELHFFFVLPFLLYFFAFIWSYFCTGTLAAFPHSLSSYMFVSARVSPSPSMVSGLHLSLFTIHLSSSCLNLQSLLPLPDWMHKTIAFFLSSCTNSQNLHIPPL